MGGLTMGQFLFSNEIPVKFSIGIGPVPSLEKIWNNSERRRSIIANSFDLTKVDNMDSIFKKYDWAHLLKTPSDTILQQPNVYLYYGIDNVFNNEFGGIDQYKKLSTHLQNNGFNTIIKTNNSKGHASPTLYEIAITDSVFNKELKL